MRVKPSLVLATVLLTTIAPASVHEQQAHRLSQQARLAARQNRPWAAYRLERQAVREALAAAAAYRRGLERRGRARNAFIAGSYGWGAI
jgi:hypothetical protein